MEKEDFIKIAGFLTMVVEHTQGICELPENARGKLCGKDLAKMAEFALSKFQMKFGIL